MDTQLPRRRFLSCAAGVASLGLYGPLLSAVRAKHLDFYLTDVHGDVIKSILA